MRLHFRLTALALVSFIGFAAPAAVAPAIATAQTIYDANLKPLKLTAAQRPKVDKILQQSRRERNAIFRKYRINASAKPDLDKLQRASGELTRVGTRERAALAKVLTPTQLRQYDQAQSEVRRRVVNAAD
jgi:Spy/CpxP family protein refolding chaperone